MATESSRREIPQSSHEWRTLHNGHVVELGRRYDEMFRHFSQIEAVVLHSGRALRKYSRDDQDWPTVATPHFAHWTPYQETPAVLLIRPSARPRLFVEAHTSYWEGPGPRSDCWDLGSFDIEEVPSLRELPHFGRCIYVGDEIMQRPQTAVTGTTETEVIRVLDSYRTQKTAFEVAALREATSIALGGHKVLKENFLSGHPVSELDLHYEYLKSTRQRQFTEPYGNIVAIGRNAAILHHVHYDAAVRAGDLSLLVDAGATFNGLASDITRTWVRGHGSGAELFRDLIAGVEGIQQQLCRGFVVGTSYESLHNESHCLLAGVFRELKLTSASTEELVASGATRCLFPHGLGHSLGLQVHDVGMKYVPSASQNPYLRNTAVISPGQVVTVEPGVYFIETLLHKLKAMPIASSWDWGKMELLKPFGGIRIEDNILATDEGPVNLTREAEALS